MTSSRKLSRGPGRRSRGKATPPFVSHAKVAEALLAARAAGTLRLAARPKAEKYDEELGARVPFADWLAESALFQALGPFPVPAAEALTTLCAPSEFGPREIVAGPDVPSFDAVFGVAGIRPDDDVLPDEEYAREYYFGEFAE